MQKYAPLIAVAFTLSLPALALAAEAQVTLANDSISPSTIDINAGDTVVWNNVSSVSQTVQADDGTFQSGAIAPGGQFAATFNRTGTYNYYDNASGGAIVAEVVVGGTSVTTTQTSQTTYPTQYVNPNQSYVAASSNSNPTVSSLTSEVQSLIAEIDAVEGNVSSAVSSAVYGTSSSASGACPQIGSVLSPGSSGSSVTSLQEFLGVSPATGYYGPITEAAVESWQTKYNIVSSGSPSTTGYGQVGPRTAAAMAIVCGGGSYNGVSGSTTNTTSNTGVGSGVVAGFLQVTPISGNAPLAVTVAATVNTAGDCGGATYNLDFGDGTQDQQIPTPAGNCSQGNEQFQHTYQYGGTYTITLSADGHDSTATVTVAGPTQTTTTTTSTSNTGTATGSMSAFVTNGTVPFAATFYVSCASGLAYDVVFGDGTDLGGSGVSQTSCSGGLQAVTHTYNTAGNYNAQLVIFVQNSNGTVSPETVATAGISAIAAGSSQQSSNNTSNTTAPEQVSAAPTDAPSGSNTSTNTTPTNFAPPSLTADYNNSALEAQLQFTALSCGTAYTISWGDSSGSQQGPGGSSCTSGASQTSSYSPTHTYSGSGNYTVTLMRTRSDGSTQSDTASVSIVS